MCELMKGRGMSNGMRAFVAIMFFTVLAGCSCLSKEALPPEPRVSLPPGKARQLQRDDRIVAAYVFCWYSVDDGQRSGPWAPLNGRDSWTGDVEFWKGMVRQAMAANIDILYVHLIDTFIAVRGNLFQALAELRSEGYVVPKVAPFFDPEITWHAAEERVDLATEPGRAEFLEPLLAFYRQYFEHNTDEHAADYVAQIDGRVVVSVWHVHLKTVNWHQFGPSQIATAFNAEFGAAHPAFGRGVYLITQAEFPLGPRMTNAFPEADERVHQFDNTDAYTQTTFHNGVTAVQLKPGYWDQNVRTPGWFLPRDGGKAYRSAWKTIDPDVVSRVYIESFNEYDEGTGIRAANTAVPVQKKEGVEADDVWSETGDNFEYIKTTAKFATSFNNVPDWGCEPLIHDLPERVTPGQSVRGTIVLRNIGDKAWSADAGFRVEAENVDVPVRCVPYIPHTEANHGIRGVFRGQPCRILVEFDAPRPTGAYQMRFTAADPEGGRIDGSLIYDFHVD